MAALRLQAEQRPSSLPRSLDAFAPPLPRRTWQLVAHGMAAAMHPYVPGVYILHLDHARTVVGASRPRQPLSGV